MINIPEEIRNLFNTEGINKNIRIHFPNGERADICNDMIIKDSVTLTESLCSQDTLKFGLCESPVFECSVVGMENMKGATIEVFNEVYCEASVEGAVFRVDIQAYVYPIPYGTFVISECKRDADMQYRKVVAYGEMSYLSQKLTNANQLKFDIELPNLNKPLKQNAMCFIYSEFPEKAVRDLEKTLIPSPSLFSLETIAQINIRQQWLFVVQVLYSSFSNMYSLPSQIKDMYYIENSEYIRENYDTLVRTLLNSTLDEFHNLGYDCGEEFEREYLNAMYKPSSKKMVQYSGVEYYYEGAGTSLYRKSEHIQSQKPVIYPYITSGISGNDAKLHIDIPKGIRVYEINGGTSDIIADVPFDVAGELYRLDTSSLSDLQINISNEQKLASRYYSYQKDVDIKEQIRSAVELFGCLGTINRLNDFEFISIKQRFGLTPSSTLYPSENLHPAGAVGGTIEPKDYQSCWYDEDYSLPFGLVTCNFKNTSNVDEVYNLWLGEFDEDSDVSSYQTYDISNNEIIKGAAWTSGQIQAFCETIAANIIGVTYMPMELTGRGLPYVEVGDTFNVLTRSNDSITTIVLNRTLSGEQVLTDTYKSN